MKESIPCVDLSCFYLYGYNIIRCQHYLKSHSILTDLANVITVNLEGTGITDEGVISYCNTEPYPEKLESLDLNRTQVTHNILPVLQSKYSSTCIVQPPLNPSQSGLTS